MLHWCGQKLGAGANSGFQALNLAAVAGARRIILTGYDMQHSERLRHWHDDHGEGLSNPEARMLSGCARILDQVAPQFAQRGIEVLNATRQTALRGYRRVTMKEALSD